MLLKSSSFFNVTLSQYFLLCHAVVKPTEVPTEPPTPPAPATVPPALDGEESLAICVLKEWFLNALH